MPSGAWRWSTRSGRRSSSSSSSCSDLRVLPRAPRVRRRATSDVLSVVSEPIEHASEATLAFGERARIGRRRAFDESSGTRRAARRSSTCSSRPTARSSASSCGPSGLGRQADGSAELAPAVIARVDVLELEAGLLEIRRRARRRRASEAPRTSLASRTGSPRGCCAARSRERRDRAPCGSRPEGTGSRRRPGARRRARLPPSSARKRRSKRNSRRWLPTKSSTVQSAFPRARREPATELLQEERRALGRAQQQQRVDVRNVDAFVEQVDGEHDVDSSGVEVAQRAPFVRPSGCRPRSRPPGSQRRGTARP